MNRRLFSLGFGALLGAGRARAQTPPAAGPIAQALAESGAPALAGVVVTREGVIWLEAGGVRRSGHAEPVSTDSLWHLGSNTKAMTAALYARQVEQGRARWGATVPSLFPGLRIDPAWETTTVEDLLGHRAGISDRPVMAGGWLRAAHDDRRPLPVQRRELAQTVFGARPTGTPGKLEYGNLNYILVGAALESLLATDWEQAMRTQVFAPLGMSSAGFGAPTGDQPWGHRAGLMGLGYGPVDPAGPADNPPVLGPAGRVHVSLGDYARFARVFLTGGGGWLKPETVAKLTAPAAGGPYALGWGVVPDRAWAKGPMLAHAGSNTMWFAEATLAPARGIGFLTATNDGTEKGQKAVRALARLLLERHAPA